MKTLITSVVAVLALGACSSGSDFSQRDEDYAESSWNLLDDGEQAILCNVYFGTEKDEVIELLMNPPAPISEQTAEAFYDVLNEECG